MPEQFSNRAESVLASGVSVGATSITVTAGHGARFPSTGDFSILLQSAADATVYELVKATARSTDTLTVTATANAWTAGDKVVHVVDKRVMDQLVQLTGDQTIAGIKTFSSIPVGPASNPTTDNQLARKAYVDTKQAISDLAVVRKTADETVTSSTTLQDDDALLFAVAANTTWEFEFVLIVDGGTTGDFKVAVGAPAGAAGTLFAMGLAPATAANSGDVYATYIGFNGAGEVFNGRGFCRVSGIAVVGGTAGNITLRWAQGTSDATAAKVVAGSYVKAQKVA